LVRAKLANSCWVSAGHQPTASRISRGTPSPAARST
jgi:hypothetical protein